MLVGEKDMVPVYKGVYLVSEHCFPEIKFGFLCYFKSNKCWTEYIGQYFSRNKIVRLDD